MDIDFVGAARFPTEKANGYQIAQMLQAFHEAGARPRLIHYDLRSATEQQVSVETMYGLRVMLNRVTYDVPSWLIEALATNWAGPLASKLMLRVQSSRAAQLLRAGVSGPPDAIYTRHPVIAALLQQRLPPAYTRRLCVEVHALSERPQSFAREAKILAGVPRIVTITAAMRDRLLSAGLSTEQILVSHDAVDDQVFTGPGDAEAARARLNLPARGRNLCYVGRFHTLGQEKGIEEIIRAAAQLFPRHPDVFVTLVGGPEEAIDSYRALIAELGLPAERFIFPGFRPVDEVKIHLDAADILLMPMPYTHHYAFNASPLKLFQYMSAFRPIVASDLPSVREVVGDEDAALLPTPGDPAALAASIERLLTDDACAHRIASRAFELSRQYTWRARAEAIIAFLS